MWVLKRPLPLGSVVEAAPKTLRSGTLSLPKLSWLMALECAERSLAELKNGLHVDRLTSDNDDDDDGGLEVDSDDDVLGVVFGVVLTGFGVVNAVRLVAMSGLVVSSAKAKSCRSMCSPSCSVNHPIYK